MIIYGRNLSPFTRRVMIWARLQGHEMEQMSVSPGDPEGFATLSELNPSGRAPTLVLADGERMYESWAICDWLDSIAAEADRMLPSAPEARRAATQACGLANTAVEKSVAVVYEGRRPEKYQWDDWRERSKSQASKALDALEEITPAEGFFGGSKPNAVDIYAVVAVDFIAKAVPDMLNGRAQKLQALSLRANEDPIFGDTRP